MFLVIFMAFALSAEIVSRTQKVPLNSTVALLPNSCILKEGTCEKNEFRGYIYPCSSSSASFDLFTAVEYDMYPCIFICQNIAIGSPRPFYVSRKPVFPFGNLTLSDTGSFIRCDTVKGDKHIPDTPADDNRCYLPHLGNPAPKVSPVDSGCFLMIRSIVGLYALVLLKPVLQQQSYQGTTEYYITGFQITWYFQTDGSLNFSGVTGIGRQMIPTRHLSLSRRAGAMGIASGCYSIRGQKISGTGANLTIAHVVLVRNNDGLAQPVIPALTR
jgi:hypothetical protein